MNANATHSSTRHTIGADHPMLPGHFPGHPVVPGAYLLAWVVKEANAWLAAQGDARTVAGVARAKFLRPLQPEQTFHCAWMPGESLRFALATDEATIASGTLLLKPAP
jgi:3-hydroxymyristoyl/3-hydroxydecanoyl-(acyl carrier protein) dehydratase